MMYNKSVANKSMSKAAKTVPTNSEKSTDEYGLCRVSLDGAWPYLHGQTQNPNEALNQIIWSKIPKQVFVSRKVLEIGVNSAIIEYNDGASGVFDVLEFVGVNTRGILTEKGTVARNYRRIKNSSVKCSEKGKIRRKTLRSIKKGFLDTEKETEIVESYVAGGF